MITDQLDILKYPIGKFKAPENYTSELHTTFIETIEHFPSKIKKEVTGLSREQLDTPYRPGGWSIRQVVHHCADSHMNGLIRFKLTLTEDKPVIKPYAEHLVAELADTKTMPVDPGLLSLEGVHLRWVALLRSLNETDLQRTYIHPEYKKEFTLNEATALYAWHSEHHLAHITTLKKSMGW